MKAFADALNSDDNALIPDQPPSPYLSSRPGTPVHHRGSTRIRKVSALSDFAPVNVKVKRSVGTREKYWSVWLTRFQAEEGGWGS